MTTHAHHPATRTGLDIRIVYPKPGQPIDEDSTFLLGGISGWKNDSAMLLINGHPVPVSPHGFFAWKIPVHPGKNPVELRVAASPDTPTLAIRHLILEGTLPFSVLPASPLALHEETLRPSGDIWLTTKDSLRVACSASEGAQVSFTIPGLVETPVPIPPAAIDAASETGAFLDTRQAIFAHLHWTGRRIPLRGYYQATIPVRALLNENLTPSAHWKDRRIILHLKHGSRTLSHPLPGQLTILSQPHPARLKKDEAITRTAPEDGSRLTPQRRGLQLAIDGLEREWCRVRLSGDEAFYIAYDDLDFETTHASVSPASLASIRTRRLGDHSAEVALIFSQQPASVCPIRVETLPPASTGGANRLQIRIYNVQCRCDFIHYPPDSSDIVQGVHWRPLSETVMEVWIDLSAPLAGYDYRLENGEWRFTVKTRPNSPSTVRVLIDPGHGGAESGALGLNGAPEKSINLAVSLLLRDALRAEGFSAVSMTRETDRDVSLPERGHAVLATGADIVLSIHHNALPDGRDPLKEHGVSLFYYHSFSKALADTLYRGLSAPDGGTDALPGYGVFYDSLYMTRIRQATAVLVELGFLTHPDEFERLIQPGFQHREAQRIARLLKNYILGTA